MSHRSKILCGSRRRVETSVSNQWASPGGPEEILAFPFLPTSEDQAAWEDLGLTMRMGIGLVGMVEGVGIWVLGFVAVCWDEDSERRAFCMWTNLGR